MTTEIDPQDDQAAEPLLERNGNQIDVRDIKDATSVAIGRGARAIVYQGLTVDQVAALVVELQNQDQPTVWDGRFPYLGLNAFQESDAEFFFGREGLVDDLLERVDRARFVTIAGPSGSGKSSLARAGLFHTLRKGRLERSDTWLLATMQPKGDPLEQLAMSIDRQSGKPGTANSIRETGLDDPLALHKLAETLLTDDKRQRFVLLVDQFEETFTQTNSEEERYAFIDLLTTAAQVEDGRSIIAISLRSDFVSNCALYPELSDLISQEFQLVTAMAARDLAKAITLPALEVGAEIEPALVKQIIDDMKGEPGALPLMSFALLDLFEAEKTGIGQAMDMTLEEYLQRGGIEDALQRHANEVFASFSAEQQDLAQGIFARLITVGEGRLDTRRTAQFQELVPADVDAEAVAAVIARLSAEGVRLVTTSGVEDDEELTAEELAATQTTVTIAHEKLIDAWPWLRRLIDENRELIALQNRINHDAREWEDDKEDPGFLYRGGRLLHVEENLEALAPSLDELSLRFVQTSIDDRQRRIAEEEAQRRRTITILAAATAVALGLAAIAIFFFLRSNQSLETANNALDAEATAILEAQANLAIANENSATAKRNLATAAAAQATSTFSEGQAEAEATKALAAQELAEEEARRARAVSLAQITLSRMQELSNADDLSLLLAREAVNTTLDMDGYIQPSASIALVNAVDSAVPYRQIPDGRHTADVRGAEFSPDGAHILTASLDGSAKLWDAQTAENLQTFSGHTASLTSAAYSPEGHKILTSSSDGTARLWDSATGKTVVEYAGHTGTVNDAAFSPDVRQIVTAGDDAFVKIWDLATAQELLTVEGHDGPVRSAQFSPSGEKILTSGDDGTAKVWETTTGEELLSLAGHAGGVNQAEFSADGELIVTASRDGKARIWSAETGEMVGDALEQACDLDSCPLYSATFSPDGENIVTATYKLATIWDAATGEMIAHLPGHVSWLNSVKFNAGGDKLVTTANDETAKIWDLNSGEELQTLGGHAGQVFSAIYSPDGAEILITGQDRMPAIWNLETGERRLRFVGHTDEVESARYSSDGALILTAGDDGTVRVWDAQSGEERLILSGFVGAVDAAAFSPDGRTIATAGEDMLVRLWDAETGEQLHEMSGHTNWAHSVDFSPDGQFVVSTAEWDGETPGNTAIIWDVNSGSRVLSFDGHSDAVWSGRYSPDGRRIVTTSADGTVRVWDAQTGEELLLLTGHDDRPLFASWNSDGSRIVSAARDNTIMLWDASTGLNLLTLVGHGAQVRSAVFGPEDDQILSASWDGTVRLWDINQQGHPGFRARHTGRLPMARYSPDGSLIVTSGVDRVIAVWDRFSGEKVNELAQGDVFAPYVEISPDEKHVLMSDQFGPAKIWDFENSEIVLRVAETEEDGIWTAAFSPDGQRFVTTSYYHANPPTIWQTATGEQLGKLEGHAGFLRRARFSPDGEKIATAGDDGTVRIWDAATQDQLLVFDPDEVGGTPLDLAFSPNGTRLAVGGVGDFVNVWDEASGERLLSLPTNMGIVMSVNWRPDGRRLVASGQDGEVKVWDMESGQVLFNWTIQDGLVASAVFSPDGEWILTASADGVAREWPADPDIWLASLESLISRNNKALFDFERRQFANE